MGTSVVSKPCVPTLTPAFINGARISGEMRAPMYENKGKSLKSQGLLTTLVIYVRKIKLNLSLKITKKLYKMGVKSASNANSSQSNSEDERFAKYSTKPYTKHGLVFESEVAYKKLKAIDKSAKKIIGLFALGIMDMKAFFSNYDKVKVKESYDEAYENIEIIFPNITEFSMMKLR